MIVVAVVRAIAAAATTVIVETVMLEILSRLKMTSSLLRMTHKNNQVIVSLELIVLCHLQSGQDH